MLTVSIHGDPAESVPVLLGLRGRDRQRARVGLQPEPAAPARNGREGVPPALATALEAIAKFRPAFLVVAFGTDTHEADPIGGFKLPTGYFREMGAAVRELGLPTVVTQEGGYNLDAIGPCVAGFLAGLKG